jgi:iron complex outermembrane recepter protein
MHGLLKRSASALAMVLASGAIASAETLPDIETILVTAPGPDREAGELIGNAEVLTRDDLIEVLEPSLGNALTNQAGVSSTFFGQAASRPVLRGLGAERVQVLTNGLGVIDASAASPDHQVAGDALDAVRVEILRGPAALAYGGQAVGGVVNVLDGLIASEIPDQTISGEVLGFHDSVAEGETLNGSLTVAGGGFVFKVGAGRRDLGNYEIPGAAESRLQEMLEEAEDHDHDDHDEGEHGAEGLLENSFVETDTLSAGLSYVGARGFIGVSARLQGATYGLPGHSHGHEEHDHDDHQERQRAKVDTVFAEDEEEEEAAFIDLEHLRFDLRAGYRVEAGGFTNLEGALSFVDYEHTEFEAAGEPGTVFANEGFEGRFEADYAIGFGEGALGVQFISTELSAQGDEAFITATDREAIGVFVYHTREFGDGYGIELGGRAERVELNNINVGERSFDLVSGSIGLHRHFQGGLFAGAQLSLSERAPNETELFADGPHLATRQYEVGDASLDKERGVNLEGTLRWQSDTVVLGINAYRTQFDNFITLLPRGDEADNLPVFVFTGDDATLTGSEIYADLSLPGAALGADWTIGASLDAVDGDLDSGGDIPLLPPLSAKLRASADWGRFGLGVRTTLADTQRNSGAGYLETEGYQLVDFISHYTIERQGMRARLFAELRNAFDEEARIATSTLKDFAPLPGRNLRLGVRVQF